MIGIYHGLLPEAPDELAAHAGTRIGVDRFQEHVRLLVKERHVVPLRSYVQAFLEQGKAPHSLVCLTFDDGYSSVLELAWPILQRYEITATVFCTTRGAEGHLLWHDVVPLWMSRATTEESCRLLANLKLQPSGDRVAQLKQLKRYLKQLPVDAFEAVVKSLSLSPPSTTEEARLGWKTLDWAQIDYLLRQGMEIGNHTCSHLALSNASSQRVQDEILGAALQLEQRLGLSPSQMPFSYPNGGLGDAPASARESVRSAGHYCGLLAGDEHGLLDRYRLPRVNLGYDACPLAEILARYP